MKTMDIENCARCGNDHRNVVFKQFEGKYVSMDGFDYQYWGWCPTNLEPILASVPDEEIPLDGADKEETEESQVCPVCRCSSKCKDSKLSVNEVVISSEA
jgi:hypothetical protein